MFCVKTGAVNYQRFWLFWIQKFKQHLASTLEQKICARGLSQIMSIVLFSGEA